MKAKKTRYLIPLLILTIIITFSSFSCSPQGPADQTIEEPAQETAEEIAVEEPEEEPAEEVAESDSPDEDMSGEEEENVSEDQELISDTYNIGDIIDVGELKLIVNEIKTLEGSENKINLFINISIENTGNEDRAISSLYMFNLVDEFKRSQTVSLSGSPNGDLDGIIPPSKTMTGELAYIVDEDIKNLELEITLNITNDEIEFLDKLLALVFSGEEEDDIDKTDIERAEEIGSREPVIVKININE